MTLQNEVKEGEEAERLLNNPVYQKSIEKVRTGLINAMSDSPMGDEKTHNRLVIALQLLSQIEKNIKTVAETGKLAKIQINQTPMDKVRRFVGR